MRNDVAASGAATPLQKDTWVVADAPEFAVPVDFQPIHGSPEMVRVIPTRPLAPGLYSVPVPPLRIGRGGTLRRPMVEDRQGPIRVRQLRRPLSRASRRPPYRLCSDLSAALPKQQIAAAAAAAATRSTAAIPTAASSSNRPQQNTFQQQLIQPYKTPPAVPQAPEPPPAPRQQALQQQSAAGGSIAAAGPDAVGRGLKLRDVQGGPHRRIRRLAILTVRGDDREHVAKRGAPGAAADGDRQRYEGHPARPLDLHRRDSPTCRQAARPASARRRSTRRTSRPMAKSTFASDSTAQAQ